MRSQLGPFPMFVMDTPDGRMQFALWGLINIESGLLQGISALCGPAGGLR
jgi:hypothetical protein